MLSTELTREIPHKNKGSQSIPVSVTIPIAEECAKFYRFPPPRPQRLLDPIGSL